MRLAGQRPVSATQRDFDAVARRLGQVREKRKHFRSGLEAMLGRKLAAGAVADDCSLRNADQRIMSFIIGGPGEISLVGGDERQ